MKSGIDICNDKYNANLTFQGITQSGLDDPKVYQLLKEGHTQNIFQFSSVGMTKFLMSMKPNKIEDLIAANALYRPATLDSGSADKYVTCKLGDAAPVYLWGTYNILKETYGQMVFQEDLAQISREIGGFSLGEGVKLVKLISKKKVDKIKALKDKFMEGALTKGCPKDDAVAIWDMIESGGSYLFNKCIAGYETIHRAKGKHELLTIAEMYKTMHDSKWAEENGHKYLCQKYRRNGYGTGWSLDKNDRLIKNYIKDIRYMGIKPIYRITLENGATIDVTANHKHPTARGIKRTDELVVGVDKMYVNAGYIKSDTSYRFTDKGMRNDPRYHSDKNMEHYELNSKKGHIGFYKRKTNYTQFKFYRENLKKDYCEICGKRDCRLEVHHINKDHSDCGENFSNLQTLCASCHKKAHYQIGRVKQGEKGLDVETIKVVSVEYLKDDEVYDVEMYDPYHTFVTSKGIVTCNSHATAYAITAYVGAFLKANYPSAFYTIALQWADDKEIPSLMSEMEQCSKAKIVHPDINVSDIQFFTDYQHDEIFWSLTRIKMVGVKTVEYIVEERQKNGAFTSIENFIHRIFKYKLKKYEYWDDPDNEEEARKVPVNARHVKHLILAGCFDKIENVKSLPERYRILCVAAKELGFDLKEEDFPSDMTDKHYFWSMLQIEVSGIGSVDYRRIYDNSEAKQHIRGRASYMTIKDAFLKESEGKRIAVCATVLEHDEVEYQDKKTGEKKTFCKLKLQQNNDIIELVMWDDFYKANRDKVIQSKNKMIIVSAIIKYSDYSGCHCLQTYKSSMLFNV